jgi:molybdate transport system substrate-binding protein
MRHLADSDATRPIGCTQSTEIISTKGVTLSGSLPRGCDLSTGHARVLIDLLSGADQGKLRERAGFLDVK